MKYTPDLKNKYRSQIHTTLALKDHLKAVCDKQAIDEKLMLLTPSKSTGHTSRKKQNLLEGSSSASQTSTWRSAPAHAPSFSCLTASYQKAAKF